MKRAALPTALAFLLIGSLCLAQTPAPADPPPADTSQPAPPPARAENPQRQAKRLAKQLGLTPDQTAKLEPILADRDRKMAAVRANTALSPLISQAQMRAIQQSTQQQLGAVLTVEQMQQLKALRQQRREASAPQSAPSPAPAN